MAQDLLGPLLAMVGVTFIVWFYMYVRRIAAMREARLHPDHYKRTHNTSALPDEVNYSADNLKNLFEVPILFYALCLAAMATQIADPFMVMMAWLFVAFRALHSAIQCTYNRVMHRFMVYILSTSCLLAMFLRIAKMVFWG